MKLSEKIIELRKTNGMTQEELAAKCNVSRQSVSKWEADIALPETEKLLMLGEIFHVSMDVLLKEELTLSEIKEVHSCGNNAIQGKKQDVYEGVLIKESVTDDTIIDLLKCGIQNENIKVFDLHTGMESAELQKYDVVYLCGGDTAYLIERVNATGFHTTLMEYIHLNGMVIGVSAGSLLFANNLPGNLGLINTRLEVHCPDGETRGKVEYPIKKNMRLTNTSALVIREFPDGLEIIGE